MESEISGLRVLLVHEWLYTWAGAERCLEEMTALFPRADVLVGIVTPDMRRLHPIAARARETWVGRLPGARAHHRWFLPLHAAAFASFDTRGYDLVISLSHAFEKAVRARRGTRHLCYCFSPPRYFWDLRDAYAAQATLGQRLALVSLGPAMRALDRAAARGVDHFVSISRHVAGRVQRCYGRTSDVVYPPVRLKAEKAPRPNAEPPFLLSLGRIVPYKRVDLAIQAADRLQMRLVIAGDGPERSRLEQMGSRYAEFMGAVSEEQAGRLMATCAAFIFCGEEDFGIAPIEANAHGAPVVAYARGAATETMTDGVTAMLFDRQEVDSVVSAVERCLAGSWNAARLRANAGRFAPEHFHTGIRAAVARTLA